MIKKLDFSISREYLKVSTVKVGGGTTIRSYTSVNGINGLFQQELNVHTKKVCNICNNDIEKIRVNGRGTYYCPKCQK